MHYRNGREANNGDKVVKLSYEEGKIIAFGVLHDATPGNDYCYTAKALKVRWKKGKHQFISPNTGKVAPAFH